MENSTYRIHITGRVQGVAFRHYTKLQADRNGVTGWVRNLHDGSVEAVISGANKQIETMTAWFYTGSPGAVVSKVAIFELEVTDHFKSFDIYY